MYLHPYCIRMYKWELFQIAGSVCKVLIGFVTGFFSLSFIAFYVVCGTRCAGFIVFALASIGFFAGKNCGGYGQGQ